MPSRSFFSHCAIMALAAGVGCGGAIDTSDDSSARGTNVGNGSDDVGNAPSAPSSPPPPAPTPSSTPLPDPDPSTRITIASNVDAGWVAVDETHVYFASLLAISRIPKAGGPVEHLADQTFMYSASELALSPTSIIFAQGMGLARMPKAGGAPVTLIPTLASYAGAIAADGDGFVAQTGEMIIRCDESQPCATEPVPASALRYLATDADWIYFKRPTPGHLESLVRAPRRGGSPGAYDVLVDDSGINGFVLVDDSRVYFERPIDSMSSRNEVVSIPKTPGGAPVVLAVNDDGFAGGLVDDTWLYWVRDQRLLAIHKDGSSPTPIVIGTNATGRSPATDGTNVYWSGRDGSIYATAVPKKP